MSGHSDISDRDRGVDEIRVLLLDLESMHPTPEGEWLVSLTVTDGDETRFEEVARQQVVVDDVTASASMSGGYEVTVSTFELATVLGEQGARLQALRTAPDGAN